MTRFYVERGLKELFNWTSIHLSLLGRHSECKAKKRAQIFRVFRPGWVLNKNFEWKMVWREALHVLEKVLHQKKKRKLAKDDIARIGEVGEGERTWVLLFSEVSSENGPVRVFGYDKKDSFSFILYYQTKKKQSVSYNSALIKYKINFALTLTITSLLFPLTLIYIITLWDKQSTETLGLVKKRNVDYFVLKEKRVFYLI